MKTVVGILALCAVMLGAPPVSASTITFNLNTVFSGATPSGSPTVTLTDTAGGVDVTVSSFPLSGNEFIDDVYLNFLGDATLLTATYESGVVANNILFGDNAFKADGDGYFDLKIDYPPPPGNVGTFEADLMSSYLFTLAGLNTSMFNASSYCVPGSGCGNGSYFAAAHIQGLAGGLSTWVGDGTGPPPPPPPPPPSPVPEPASMLLMGTGLAVFAAKYRKRLKMSKG